jgi:hypothetical protein
MGSHTAGSFRGARCAHVVQVYGDERELAGSVAAYLAEGFERAQPAIALTTPAHRPALLSELDGLGWSAPPLEDEGLLTFADAEATLASFLEGSGPSETRFHTVIGRLLAFVEARHPGRHVRLFGEMVDLLAGRGRHGAALELEKLGDHLAHRRGFSLLCTYRLDVFDPDVQRAVLPGIWRAHEHVVPAADPARFGSAVDSALAHALGTEEAERVRGLAGGARRDAHVPAAELALMWVSARMPAAAERILAAARTAYERPVLAPGR